LKEFEVMICEKSRDTFTHKLYTEYRERNIHNNKKKKIGKCGPCPVVETYIPAFVLQLSKKHGNLSVRVAERRPVIPLAVVKYTFTQTIHITTQ
jgi:hypothetical protein